MKTSLLILLAAVNLSFCWTNQNVIEILVNANDQIFVEDEPIKLDKLGSEIERLLTCEGWDCPETKEAEVPYFGKVRVTKALIAIGTDRGTSYNLYIQVQGEIEVVFSKLWNKASIKRFGKDFKSLSDEQKLAVEAYIPKRIVDMEPAVIESWGIYRQIPPYTKLVEMTN